MCWTGWETWGLHFCVHAGDCCCGVFAIRPHTQNGNEGSPRHGSSTHDKGSIFCNCSLHLCSCFCCDLISWRQWCGYGQGPEAELHTGRKLVAAATWPGVLSTARSRPGSTVESSGTRGGDGHCQQHVAQRSPLCVCWWVGFSCPAAWSLCYWLHEVVGALAPTCLGLLGLCAPSASLSLLQERPRAPAWHGWVQAEHWADTLPSIKAGDCQCAKPLAQSTVLILPALWVNATCIPSLLRVMLLCPLCAEPTADRVSWGKK